MIFQILYNFIFKDKKIQDIKIGTKKLIIQNIQIEIKVKRKLYIKIGT
jgi:hypothetical protein